MFLWREGSSHFALGALEDVPTLLIYLVRLYSALSPSVSGLTAEKRRTEVMWLAARLVFTGFSIAWKASYCRDWVRASADLKIIQTELHASEKAGKSVLDSFVGITPDEIANVICMRLTLAASFVGGIITDDDRFGDIRLLRFLRAAKGDVFEACAWVRRKCVESVIVLSNKL